MHTSHSELTLASFGAQPVPLAEGVDEVFYPGEKEARAHKKPAKQDILLPDDTFAGLDMVAAEASVPLVARG